MYLSLSRHWELRRTLDLGTGTGSSARAAASQQPAAQQQQQPAAAGARPACPADAACGEW
jgi:hypothetical protein